MLKIDKGLRINMKQTQRMQKARKMNKFKVSLIINNIRAEDEEDAENRVKNLLWTARCNWKLDIKKVKHQ